MKKATQKQVQAKAAEYEPGAYLVFNGTFLGAFGYAVEAKEKARETDGEVYKVERKGRVRKIGLAPKPLAKDDRKGKLAGDLDLRTLKAIRKARQAGMGWAALEAKFNLKVTNGMTSYNAVKRLERLEAKK